MRAFRPYGSLQTCQAASHFILLIKILVKPIHVEKHMEMNRVVDASKTSATTNVSPIWLQAINSSDILGRGPIEERNVIVTFRLQADLGLNDQKDQHYTVEKIYGGMLKRIRKELFHLLGEYEKYRKDSEQYSLRFKSWKMEITSTGRAQKLEIKCM